MCGIIGYTGRENATPYLVSGLEALEYRGYDSVGIAEECCGVGDGIYAAVREMTGSYAFVVMHKSHPVSFTPYAKKARSLPLKQSTDVCLLPMLPQS